MFLRSYKTSGFTFMELLVVVIIVGFLFSVVVPVSQELYYRYKGAIEAEKVLLFLSEKRREAFLYGEEIEIFSRDGILMTSKGESLKLEEGFIEVEKPFKFYEAGTTNGGIIKVHFKKASFVVEVKPPFSELYFREEAKENV